MPRYAALMRSFRAAAATRPLIIGAVVALLSTGCSGSDTPAGGDVEASPTAAAATGTDTTELLAIEPVAAPATNAASAEPATVSASAEAKEWTVLVYSMADTDLEPFMMSDVGEMGAVGTGEHLNVVALVDRAADYSTDAVLEVPDWQGARLLRIGQGTAEVLDDLGDVNTGDPQVLADFVGRAVAENPARHYALIISDHGASWPGVGGDESSDHDSLSLAEIADGIGAGLSASGVGQLDLLGFDACLMATYEVASTLAPLAQRMIASQELEPGHGWDYRSLGVLDSADPVDVDTLGSAILDGYRDQAEAQGTGSDITLSLLDLTRMGALDDAVAEFSAALAGRAAEVAPVIGTTRERTLSFGRSPDPTEDTQMTDLGQLVSQIGVRALDVSDPADAVIRALGDVVTRTVEGPATLKSTGLSIYFPPTEVLLDPGYQTAVGQSAWLGLLRSYYGAGDAIPSDSQPRFLDPAGTAEITFDPDGLTITGQLDPATVANITQATMSYGVVGDDGSISFLGEEPAVLSDDGSDTVSGTYDLSSFTISDGTESVTAYFQLAYDEGGLATIDIPMAYYSPDDIGGETYQDVLLSVTLDAATFEIVDETYFVYDDDLGTFGELTADPQGIIVPEILVSSPDGVATWEPTSDTGLFADLPSLEYEVVPLDPGTRLSVSLSVTDFGGNSATVSATASVP